MKTKQRLIRLFNTCRAHAGALPAIAALIAVPTGAIAGDLTIELSGITVDRGKIFVAVYDRQETFPVPGHQLVGRLLDPTDRHLTVHFRDLPPGQYAAVAYQDSNGNGKLDKNFLGIPAEPYGFSNSARGSVGPPEFAAAAVTLNPDGTTRIELQ